MRKSELDRIRERIESASVEQISQWQKTLNRKRVNCGVDGDRAQFNQVVSDAYLKLPQYREEICRVLGIKSQDAWMRWFAKWGFVLTCVVVGLSVISLVLALSTRCATH